MNNFRTVTILKYLKKKDCNSKSINFMCKFDKKYLK